MKEIFIRRSIREYSEKMIENEKIDKLLCAAMQAPSAANQRPWEFIIVRERNILDKLSKVHAYSKMINRCSVCLVLSGNLKRMVFPEFWQQDMSAAAQNILLEATHLGLGAVWIGIAPIEKRMNYLREILELDDYIQPFCLISLGYPKNFKNTFIDRYDSERVKYIK